MKIDIKENFQIKIVIVAVACAILALFLVHRYIYNKVTLLTGGERISVIVANDSIKKGSIISEEKLSVHIMPKKYVPANAITIKDKNFIILQKAAVNISKADVILWSDIYIEKSKKLSDFLKNNERALTIAVDSIAGVNGLIEPGDCVDIVLTTTASTQEYGPAERISKVVLQNVKILAVGEKSVANIGNVNNSDSDILRSSAKNLTLKLTIEEAMLLTFSETQGKLKFFLRNKEDVGLKDIAIFNFEKLCDFDSMKSSSERLHKEGYPLIFVQGKEGRSGYMFSPKGKKGVGDVVERE